MLFLPYGVSSVSWASLLARCHLSVGPHMNSIRYHLFLAALTCTPVDCADPVKIYRPLCNSFTIFSIGV